MICSPPPPPANFSSFEQEEEILSDKTFRSSSIYDLQDEAMLLGSLTLTFPMKLYHILQSVRKDVIDWLASGNGFRIKNLSHFTSVVLPTYFRHSKIGSFQRQLNIYGFKRILGGKDKGCYVHPDFKQNNFESVTKIKRVALPPSKKKLCNETVEVNFQIPNGDSNEHHSSPTCVAHIGYFDNENYEQEKYMDESIYNDMNKNSCNNDNDLNDLMDFDNINNINMNMNMSDSEESVSKRSNNSDNDNHSNNDNIMFQQVDNRQHVLDCVNALSGLVNSSVLEEYNEIYYVSPNCGTIIPLKIDKNKECSNCVSVSSLSKTFSYLIDADGNVQWEDKLYNFLLGLN